MQSLHGQSVKGWERLKWRDGLSARNSIVVEPFRTNGPVRGRGRYSSTSTPTAQLAANANQMQSKLKTIPRHMDATTAIST